MSTKAVVFLLFVLWNSLVFASYGLDKRRARRGSWRISEKTLLLESLFLEGIGAFLGGKVFRHKTRNRYFRLVWYLGLLGDIAFLYWLVWLWR